MKRRKLKNQTNREMRKACQRRMRGGFWNSPVWSLPQGHPRRDGMIPLVQRRVLGVRARHGDVAAQALVSLIATAPRRFTSQIGAIVGSIFTSYATYKFSWER